MDMVAGVLLNQKMTAWGMALVNFRNPANFKNTSGPVLLFLVTQVVEWNGYLCNIHKIHEKHINSGLIFALQR